MVKCDGCGDTFPRHPALEIPCPTCGARKGSSCIRPSEHRTMQLHSARRKAAFELKPCRCLANWLERQTPQQELAL